MRWGDEGGAVAWNGKRFARSNESKHMREQPRLNKGVLEYLMSTDPPAEHDAARSAHVLLVGRTDTRMHCPRSSLNTLVSPTSGHIRCSSFAVGRCKLIAVRAWRASLLSLRRHRTLLHTAPCFAFCVWIDVSSLAAVCLSTRVPIPAHTTSASATNETTKRTTHLQSRRHGRASGRACRQNLPRRPPPGRRAGSPCCRGARRG